MCVQSKPLKAVVGHGKELMYQVSATKPAAPFIVSFAAPQGCLPVRSEDERGSQDEAVWRTE